MYFDLWENSTLFDVYQELRYGFCMGLTMMWQIVEY
jgi:hypothetical protein